MDIKLNKINDYYISLNLDPELKKKLFSLAAGFAIASFLRFPDLQKDLEENKDVTYFYKKELERFVNIKLSALNETVIFDLNLAKETTYNFYMAKWEALNTNKPKIFNDKFSFLCLVLGMNFFISEEIEKICDDNKLEIFNLFKKIFDYFITE